MPVLTIAGSIHQAGKALNGAVHVDGSNCFDQLTTVPLSGTLTGNTISLTTTTASGQVATFTGTVTDTAFTGAYTITGGCAGGDQGNVTGIKVPLVMNSLSGTFTTSGNDAFNAAAQLTQGGASPQGSFGITGTVTFSTSCFTSGTIKSGTFPSGSFILGTFVTLEIETGNGTVTFVGKENEVTGEISGKYTVSGGTCDRIGIADLVASGSWDY
jgi:hypothetical protein